MVLITCLLFAGVLCMTSCDFKAGDWCDHIGNYPNSGAYIDEACLMDLPSSLSFFEPLSSEISAQEVVIYTGGHSLQRCTEPFALYSASSLLALAKHHGYSICFLDQLDYSKELIHLGYSYANQWQKVFAMEALRGQYPRAKYWVWVDDDILAPYPETSMLNHYINLMEQDSQCHIMVVREGFTYQLNTGIIIMRNSQIVVDIFDFLKEAGAENGGRLARTFGHEQDAMFQARIRMRLLNEIKFVSSRDGPYNFNTFARDAEWDLHGAKAQYGDAFVHFLGQSPDDRKNGMAQILDSVQKWRETVPRSCVYPIGIQ